MLHARIVSNRVTQTKRCMCCSELLTGEFETLISVAFNGGDVFMIGLTSLSSSLGLLKAVESIDAVVSLCDSTDEELHQVAIETLLTFGNPFRVNTICMDCTIFCRIQVL